MRRARRPGGLSLLLERLEIGESKTLMGYSKDRVRATLQGATTLMSTHHPERRFALDYLTPRSCLVTRKRDVELGDPAEVMAEARAVEAAFTPMVAGITQFTEVPADHAFAVWAVGRGRGSLVGGLWVWEHQGGQRAQRAVMLALRRRGVPARRRNQRS